MTTRSRHHNAFAALLLASTLPIAPLFAQPVPPGSTGREPTTDGGSTPSAVAPDAAGGVEDIVVTAQRREQNLQQVPLAVSAFSANSLAALRVDNSTDLLRFVPNVIAFNNGGQGAQSNYYFRGVGTPDGLQTFDSPVVTYLDDIVLGRIVASNINFLDLDRVEVLRGPQGTLFGRNVTGGAVLYYSRKPAEQFQAKIELATGERQRVEARTAIDVPLSDTLFSQVTAYYQRENGFYRSVATGANHIGGDRSYGVRVALRFVPSDTLTWDLAADYSSQNKRAPGLQGGDPALPAELKNDIAGTLFQSPRLINELLLPCHTGNGPRQWVLNNCSAAIARNMGITSNIRIELGGVDLNLITGLRRSDQDYALDFGGNNPRSATREFILANDSQFDQFSQEVKLTGNLFEDRLKYVAGLFYFREHDNTIVDDFLRGTSGPRTGNTTRDLSNTTNSLAAYVQTDFSITPELTLTGGVRYTRDRKKVDIVLRNYNTGALIFNTAQIADPRIKSERVTPRVAVQYQATPDIMTFASYTRGFKSGGWGGRAGSAISFTSFGDEIADSYEIGARTQFFDNRLRFNVTAFYVKYKGLQINTAFVAANGQTIFVTDNAGDARDKGVEIESSFSIAREFSGNVSAGFQRGKFTRLTPGAIAANLRLTSPLPQTPKETYAAGLTWAPQFDFGKITANIAGQYIPAYTPAVTSTGLPTDDLVFVNASLAFAPSPSVEFAVECKNCFRSYENLYPFVNGSALLNIPTYGVRLRYKL